MHFASTWNKLLKDCIFVEFLMLEGLYRVFLRKELHIAPFKERFKTATLGRSY